MGLAKASLEANVRFMAASLGPKGIRVNAISAGPIKTLAAAGIGSFGKLLSYTEKVAPYAEMSLSWKWATRPRFCAATLRAALPAKLPTWMQDSTRLRLT